MTSRCFEMKTPAECWDCKSQASCEAPTRVEPRTEVVRGPFNKIVKLTPRAVIRCISLSHFEVTVRESKEEKEGLPLCMVAPLAVSISPDRREVFISDGEWVFAEATGDTALPPAGEFVCGSVKLENLPGLKRVWSPVHPCGVVSGHLSAVDVMYDAGGNKWICNGIGEDGHAYFCWKRRDLHVLPTPVEGAAFSFIIHCTDKMSPIIQGYLAR